MVASFANSRPPVFFLIVWCLYLIGAPFYPFAQGAAQPAAYFLALFGFPALAMAALSYQGKFNQTILYGALFASLTLIVNLLHYLVLPDPRFLLSSVYYLFNIGLFFYVVLLFYSAPDIMNRYTYGALAISLVTQTLYVAFWGPMDGARALGSFTNPNQLAYWTLLTSIMLAVLKRRSAFAWYDYALLACALFIQTAALSKAGLITTGLFLLTLFFLPYMRQGGRWLVTALVCISMIVLVFDPIRLMSGVEQVEGLSSIVERLGTLGQERDDSAEGRGYLRIMEAPYYLLFGAGEGGFARFDGPMQELHSGIATLIFSYGFTGFLLFAAFIWQVFYRLPRHYLILLGIILLFGVVHQSLRFSHFWVFLGVCYGAVYLHRAHDERSVGTAESERVG